MEKSRAPLERSTQAPILEELGARLESLSRAGLRRRLDLPAGIDFASNDYLALSRHPDLLAFGPSVAAEATAAGEVAHGRRSGAAAGAPGSRLLRGHRACHEELEARLAAWKGTEAALLFPSGWQANAGLLTALIGPQDRVLSDALNHASLIDALRLTRCQRVIYPHLDLETVALHLEAGHDGSGQENAGRTFVVTESLYSMDGDVAPLGDLAALCKKHRAELIVDDAHATGLYGERGSGLVEHFAIADQVLAVISTGGKALGLGGAFVAGSQILRDYLINTSRPFIFTTAVPPLLVTALGRALEVLEAEPWRRSRVLQLAAHLRRRLAELGVETLGEGPIVPLLIGENRAALEVSEKLRQQGYDVRAVRPPTVPANTARVRISVHADHDEAVLDALASSLVAALGETAEEAGAGEILALSRGLQKPREPRPAGARS